MASFASPPSAINLLENPQILLRLECDRSCSLKSFEGKVGAISDDGQTFITTPNMDIIYAPPNNAFVSIKDDFHLGDDDHTIWPQPYVTELPYFAAISRKPATPDPSRYDAILHYSPMPSDFLPVIGGPVTGLGRFNGVKVSQLRKTAAILRGDLEIDRDRHNELDFTKSAHLYTNLMLNVERGLTSLEYLPMTRKQACFIFVSIQRYLLEYAAACRYEYNYRIKMMNEHQQPPEKAESSAMGAFTSNLRIADELHRAGLPVWLVHPAKLAGSIRVDRIVKLTRPGECGVNLQWTPASFPAKLKGAYGTFARYEAIIQCSRSFLAYPDPFNVASSISSSSAALSRASASTANQAQLQQPSEAKNRRAFTPYDTERLRQGKTRSNGSGGRDKFDEFRHPLIPLPLPIWSSALAAVDRGTFGQQQRSGLDYVFPEPGLLLGPETNEKQARYLYNWVKFRPVLLHRLVSSFSSASALDTQHWRTMLNLPVDQRITFESNVPEPSTSLTRPTTKVKKSKARQHDVHELLRTLIGNDPDLAVNGGPSADVYWERQQISSSHLPEVRIGQEILWELHELNFRFEFRALDARAHQSYSTSFDTSRREDLVASCFPTSSLLVADLVRAHEGLTAESWQDRRPYVLAMRCVMKTWKDFCWKDFCRYGEELVDGKFVMTKSGQGEMTDTEFLAIEAALVRFYTQSFYNFFFRAPVIPRCLSRS